MPHTHTLKNTNKLTPIPITCTRNNNNIFFFFQANDPCPYKVGSDGNWYRLHNEFKTFDEAKQLCEAEGGKLMTVRSQATLDLLQSIYKIMKDNLWLGATDLEREGSFKWIYPVNGSSQLVFKNWGSGEPNGGTSENYLHLYHL